MEIRWSLLCKDAWIAKICYMNYLDFIAACQNQAAEKKVEDVIAKCSQFKIGKTGQTLEDRGHQSDYSIEYEWIEKVFVSTSKDEVSKMEAYLIDKYKNHPKCDNEKGGEASVHDAMTEDTSEYIVYVVWK